MYIKWRRREPEKYYREKTLYYYAYLVESYRDKQGKVKQRKLSYLGNITKEKGAFPLPGRIRFYEQVEKSLGKTKNLTQKQKHKIFTAIEKKVARPSHQEIEEWRRQMPAGFL